MFKSPFPEGKEKSQPDVRLGGGDPVGRDPAAEGQ